MKFTGYILLQSEKQEAHFAHTLSHRSWRLLFLFHIERADLLFFFCGKQIFSHGAILAGERAGLLVGELAQDWGDDFFIRGIFGVGLAILLYFNF